MRIVDGQPTKPLQIAVQVEANQIIGRKVREDPLAIAGWRRCRHRTYRVAGRASRGPELALPQLVTRLEIKAQHVQAVLLDSLAGRDDDAITDHDWTGRSAPRQVGLPGHVLLLLYIPFHGRRGLGHSQVPSTKMVPIGGD